MEEIFKNLLWIIIIIVLGVIINSQKNKKIFGRGIGFWIIILIFIVIIILGTILVRRICCA